MGNTLTRLPLSTVNFDSEKLPIYVGSLGLLLTLTAWSLSKPKRNLPPGPKGLPILGNIFQLPQFQWLRFTEWKEQYGRQQIKKPFRSSTLTVAFSGPIFSLNLAGQPVIVLNSHKVAADLLGEHAH